MSLLTLRQLSGQWDDRLIVRPQVLVWNFQDHPYARAPIPRPENGVRFSVTKNFRWHARRTGGKRVTNFKVERGAYPMAGMKLWWVALPCADVDEFNAWWQLDPYLQNYYPSSVSSTGQGPNFSGFTGQEVAESGAGQFFDTTIYTNKGFVGCMIRMCLGIEGSLSVGTLEGPQVCFSYQEL